MLRLIEGFLDDNERTALLDAIAPHAAAFRRVDGKGGVGPRYSVMDGELVAARLPSIVALGERLRPLAEDLGGTPLEFFADPRRRMRVQRYDGDTDGFRWHFDGHPFAATVTLENESVLDVIDAGTSRFVKPFFYAAYPLPQVASLLPRRSISVNAGDAVVMRGREILHRGHSRRNGPRTILVFAYDHPGTRPGRLTGMFARWANY